MSEDESKDPAIRVRELRHCYDDFEALRGLSFEVPRGEIFGLVGPNGAGKTTLLRIVATLLEPTAGSVEVNGRDIESDPDGARRSIGYMSDQAGIYERLSVREFLEFFAGASQVESDGVVQAALALTDLERIQDRLVSVLSKGMKQRLQVARVLLNDPAILLLDEPASDLDPRARIEMRDLLLELQSMGKTIVLSSHILSELAELCSGVAIIDSGTLVVAGSIRDIPDQLRVPHGTCATSDSIDPEERSLRLRVLGNPNCARDLLEEEPVVTKTEVHPHGYLVVRHLGGDEGVAKLARTLTFAGVGLVGIEPERNELERIFLRVTKGELH